MLEEQMAVEFFSMTIFNCRKVMINKVHKIIENDGKKAEELLDFR